MVNYILPIKSIIFSTPGGGIFGKFMAVPGDNKKEKATLQTKERRALPMMITDLVQTGIFIVALIGLCYTVFKSTLVQM